MIPNLPANTTYAVHLRAASSSGGKDWVGAVTAQGEIHTYWGKTGQITQHAGKPGDITTLNKIINQKQHGKDRYSQVDEYDPQHGWQSQRRQTQSPAQSKVTSVSAPVVNWVEAPTDAITWDF